MAMTAIEATIVSTAMPQIVADLGGLRLYSWVFSSFLLAQTAMTVVFGNLADVYGRKPIMLVGIGIFLLGSLFAGFAWSMPVMICCRIIQGVGAGAMQPVAMTIVADLYPARERGKVQGYLASVWAVAAVIGPVLGGLIIRSASWAWIFWINIPVGIAAAAGYILFLNDHSMHERRSIDVGGTIAFTVAVTSLLVALTEVGNHHPMQLAAAVALACVAAAVFVLLERRVKNPIVSFALWSHRPIAATNCVGVLASMTVIGLTTFLPDLRADRHATLADHCGTCVDDHAHRLAGRRHIGGTSLSQVCTATFALDGSAAPAVGGHILCRAHTPYVAADRRVGISRDGLRHGPDQRALARAHTGNRRFHATRQRHGVESLLA